MLLLADNRLRDCTQAPPPALIYTGFDTVQETPKLDLDRFFQVLFLGHILNKGSGYDWRCPALFSVKFRILNVDSTPVVTIDSPPTYTTTQYSNCKSQRGQTRRNSVQGTKFLSIRPTSNQVSIVASSKSNWSSSELD